MTHFWLVRHGAHDWLGRGIAGRLAGVSLNEAGHGQAQALVERLADVPFTAICSSPQPRARETVQPLARARGVELRIEPAFDEIDFGDWTGRPFDWLDGQGAAWRTWCDRRSAGQPPGGESILEVQQRALAGLERLRAHHPEGHVLVASHGDVIKAVLADCLGMSLDALETFEISPASVSVVAVGADWRKVQAVNVTGGLE